MARKTVFLAQRSGSRTGTGVPVVGHAAGLRSANGLFGAQAHIYSLGATLKAALEYVAEPEPEPRLSRDLEVLLGQMQAEDPGDRPDLEVSATLSCFSPELRPETLLTPNALCTRTYARHTHRGSCPPPRPVTRAPSLDVVELHFV